MTKKTQRKARRTVLIVVLALVGLCLLASLVSALTNLGLPKPETYSFLPDVDKARLNEALHLKSALGDQVWPGWGTTHAPVIIWNQANQFLVNFPGTTPDGWTIVANDTFDGQPYYRQPVSRAQNFAVLVGNQMAASMASKSTTDLFLINSFQSLFPTPLKQIFPYRFLIQPSETQIGGVLHEDFHVFQNLMAPDRLMAAEDAQQFATQYDASVPRFSAELKTESQLLAEALEAKSNPLTAEYVRQFLQQRASRRQSLQIDPNFVEYERWLEWEEGVAKYVEVDSLRLAYQTKSYAPVPEMKSDPDFNSYQGYDKRWSQELTQLRNPTGSIDTHFYNTGMAEAFLLDRLMPDWKSKIMGPNVFLEDLLQQAVSQK